MALAGTTDQIVYLEEGDVVDIALDRVRIVDATGKDVQRAAQTVQVGSGAAELGRTALHAEGNLRAAARDQ